ncbi:sunset domain-containing protein [Rhizobium leguminosarum]|uniref:sunset domain-containing protein n=1 Tax=Rhizobium leguminosarum TaxID=384 RepID=UPI001031D9B6|nr:hypothetical protein [Rhizobium leguminosarum]TBF40441.1 hypothetical protein ELG92_10390 [Rhizobium leguminosarum]
MSKFSLLIIASSTAAFLGSGGYTLLPREFYDPACDIKGNVSIGSGAKIYHVKGQEDYEATIIRSEYGERWFCSEADARSAGWRRAGR